jgi:hypothetical protein
MVFKTFIFLVFAFCARTAYGQSDDIVYFSSTGDTVLLAFTSYVISGKDTSFLYYISRRNTKATLQRLSWFILPAHQSDSYLNLAPDTIKKYHLVYPGTYVEPYLSDDFDISVDYTTPKPVDKHEAGGLSYRTHVSVKIKCKKHTIYSKKFSSTFKAAHLDGFDGAEFTPFMRAWKINGQYFIRYSLRDEQTVKYDKNGMISYSILNCYTFVK